MTIKCESLNEMYNDFKSYRSILDQILPYDTEGRSIDMEENRLENFYEKLKKKELYNIDSLRLFENGYR
jgi:hypothetical protein